MTIDNSKISILLATLGRFVQTPFGSEICLGRFCCWLNAQRDTTAEVMPLHSLSAVAEDPSIMFQCRCAQRRLPTSNDFTKSELDRLIISHGNVDWPRSRRVLLASSRIGKKWQKYSDIAQAVRSYLIGQQDRSCCFVTGTGLVCQQLTLSSCQLFAWPCVNIALPRSKNYKTWLKNFTDDFRLYRDFPLLHSIYLSPSLETEETSQSNQPGTKVSSLPLMDRIGFHVASEIRALLLKPNSNSLRLIQSTLQQSAPQKRVFVFIPSHTASSEYLQELAISKDVALDLMEDGAIGWHFPSLAPTIKNGDETATSITERTIAFSGVAANSVAHWDLDLNAKVSLLVPDLADDFLAHHTRATPGKWPEETDQEYWIRWLTSDLKLPAAMLTLFRIITQQRLRACGDLIPGRTPMVCFSQRPPHQSFAQRQFRSHLGRWDYEPFGVAIDRKALMRFGAKPVKYVQDNIDQNPFQQKQYSHHKSSASIDWSLEREYRIAGDVHLSSFDDTSLFVFVQSAEQAKQIAPLSRWPVKYLVP